MRKKLINTLLSAVMVAGVIVIAAPAAQAAPPFGLQNFHPREDGDGIDVGGTEQKFLSDRPDGTDSLAHLTAVATFDADRVKWFACPSGTAAGGVTQAELALCDVTIGEDTTGVQPVGGSPFAPTDEAYEVFWDIPGPGIDGTDKDIVAIACIGTGDDIEAPGQNCLADAEADVYLDDSSTGAAAQQSSAGEITSICTAGAALCEVAVPGTEEPDVAARFTPFIHGDEVPADGFTFRTTTSPDVVDTFAALREDWDAESTTSTTGSDVACDLVSASTSRKVWQCTYADGAVPDTGPATELGLGFGIDGGGGSGYCETGTIEDPAGGDTDFCVFDVHYVVAQERVATTATLTFRPDGDCATTDDEERNRLGNSEVVRLCVTDQFGDPFTGDATIELDTANVTTAGFTSCTDGGTAEDHDGDGYNEHCDFTAPNDGELEATFENPQDPPGGPPADVGVQTVTGCSETEPLATDANHGCAGETVTDSVTKTWFSTPTTVDLVYAGTGDPADPCNTGDAFKANRVGQRDDLLVCTFDEFGNAISTQETGGGRLQWTIRPSGGGDRTGVEFVGSPPAETDATTAQATATVRATRRSNNDICVDLEGTDPNAPPGEADCVQKAVRRGAGGGGRADSRVTIRDRFRGRVFSDRRSCRVNRLVIVKKVRPGKDRTIGRDRTNNRGRWRLSRPNANGRFYAKIRRTARCQGDTSRRISV